MGVDESVLNEIVRRADGAGNVPSWRRKRDSNPRYSFPYCGFQDRRLKPLGHSSTHHRSRVFAGPLDPLFRNRTYGRCQLLDIHLRDAIAIHLQNREAPSIKGNSFSLFRDVPQLVQQEPGQRLEAGL